MRILIVSNLYPPYYIGGYELGCLEAAEALKIRGHEIRILTSTYGLIKPEVKGDVHRLLVSNLGLKPCGFFRRAIRLFIQEARNKGAFERIAESFKPHLIYIWNLTNVSISIALRAQQMGFSTCFYVFDNWLSRWESDPWFLLWNRKSVKPLSQILKSILSPLLKPTGLISPSTTLDLRNVQFASQYLKSVAIGKGKRVKNAQVIPWGIHPERFPFRVETLPPKHLLYVGQVVEHKGLHTVVDALKHVVQKRGNGGIRLTIAGGTIIPEYETRIRRQVKALKLDGRVRFTGFLPREALPGTYRENDILVFPSIWDEPFGITLLESMSSGLAVVATGTGGSAEILEDNINALVFPREDSEACASQIIRLMEDTELFNRIRQNGRRTIEEKFIFQNMIDKIETSLHEALK